MIKLRQIPPKLTSNKRMKVQWGQETQIIIYKNTRIRGVFANGSQNYPNRKSRQLCIQQYMYA